MPQIRRNCAGTGGRVSLYLLTALGLGLTAAPVIAQQGMHANQCLNVRSEGNHYSGGYFAMYFVNFCDVDINITLGERATAPDLIIPAGSEVAVPANFPHHYRVCYAPYLSADGFLCDYPSNPSATAGNPIGSGRADRVPEALRSGSAEQAWAETAPGYKDPLLDEGLAASKAWEITDPDTGRCKGDRASGSALDSFKRQFESGDVSACVIATQKPNMPGDYFHNICAHTDVTVRWIDNNYCSEENACSENIMAGQYGMQKDFKGYHEFHACEYPDYLALSGKRCVNSSKPLEAESTDDC